MARINAPGGDEIAHLSAGLSHWQYGNFNLYRVNPPLVRLIAVTPLLVIKPKTDWTMMSDGPFDRPEFSVGYKFMERNGSDSFWYFTICRWALIPLSLFGGWICYRWAYELFGKSSGLIALCLWCFCPNILAWGATIMPDLGAAVFGATAGYTFWKWLKSPSWTTALISGVAFGLAELSKSTWVILFALFPMMWLYWRQSIRASRDAKPSVLQLAGIMLLALYLLNLGYGFERSFQRLDEFTFISHTLRGGENQKVPGNRFRGSWFGQIPVPVPANYLNGIDIQKRDFELGRWSYLRGEHKFGGWYHYYLYALAVKTPLGTLFLAGFACVMAFLRPEYRLRFRNELIVLAPAVTILVLVSSQSGFNRHLRYVLPAVPFFYICISRIGKTFESKPRLSKTLCGAAVVATILGSLSVYPHSLSYFNLAAGGPLGGPAHLLDTNIDWGQDLLELKRFVDQHPDVLPIGLAYSGHAIPELAGFDFKPIPRNFAWATKGDDVDLAAGWYAVSVNNVFGYRYYDYEQPFYTHFQRFVPRHTAGYSIYIYHVSAEDMAKIKSP